MIPPALAATRAPIGLAERGAISVALTLCLALDAAPRAAAESFDPAAFIERGATGYTLDEPALDEALTQLVASLRPGFGSTGATSGASGFALSLGWRWSPIAPSSPTWSRGFHGDAPSSLESLQLTARKGLPAGVELEATASHELGSSLTAATFGIRWAWLEGSRGVPDLGLRIDGGAVLGDPRMTIATAGLELMLGYPVAVGGLFRMAPYAGYSARLGFSIERRVMVLDGVSADPFVTVLPTQFLLLNHGVVGLRFQSSALDLGLEATLGSTVGLCLQVGARL